MREERQSGNIPTILVVEDTEDDYQLLTIACRRAALPLQMKWVRKAEEAIKYLKGEDAFGDRSAHPFPYMVLVDLNLRGASGFEVLKWVRQQPELNGLLVWVYSGSVEATDATKAYNLDANAYLVKPNTLEEWATFTRSLETWSKPFFPARAV